MVMRLLSSCGTGGGDEDWPSSSAEVVVGLGFERKMAAVVDSEDEMVQS